MINVRAPSGRIASVVSGGWEDLDGKGSAQGQSRAPERRSEEMGVRARTAA